MPDLPEEPAPTGVAATPATLPSPGIAALLAGGPLLVGAAALAVGGFIGVSVAVAGGLLGLYGANLGVRSLAADPRRARLFDRLGRWLPPLLVVGVAVGLTWPFAVDPPISHDHPVHMTRAWHFIHEMLGRARLSGWSDLWFAGWPAGEDYPPGGDMWVSFFHLATFGALGIEHAYGVAMTALFVLLGLSAYTFGRVHFGRAAGLVAGLFFLIDPGAYREGGWSYTMDWGVWPQTLSMAWTFLAFAAMEPLVRRRRGLDVARVGALTGAALVSHPIAVILFGLGVPLYVFVRALTAPRGEAGATIVRLLAAVALGGALAAFWVLPFMGKSVWMARYGDLWLSLEEMGAKAWTGSLFQHVPPPILWLGAAGAWVGLRRQLPAALFLVLFGGSMLLLGSSTVFEELDLLSLSPAFGQVQFQRLATGAKAAVLVLAGYGLAVLVAGVREQALGARAWPRRYVVAALVAVVVAPFVSPVLSAYAKTQATGLGAKEVLSARPDSANYDAMIQWLVARRDAERDAFWRVALVRPYNDHYLAAVTLQTGLPTYKVGFTPCTNFRHKPDTMEPELLEALSVKYAVATQRLSPSLFDELATFGSLRIYRFKRYTPRRYTVEGPGTVAVERFAPGDGEMQLRVSGAGPGSRVILHVANFANWRATLDGEPVPIETAAIHGHEHFIGVPVRDGELRVRYVTPAINRVGGLVTWLGLLTLLLLAVASRRERWVAPLWRRVRPGWEWIERRGVALACGLVLVAAIGVTVKAVGRSAAAPTLRDALSEAHVSLVRSGRSVACPPDPRGHHRCHPDKSWNYVGPVVQKVGDGLRRCIWAHPVRGQELVVTFPPMSAGRALVGHHGVADSAVTGTGAPVSLEVRAEGQTLGRVVARDRVAWQPFTLDTSAIAGREVALTFVITATRDGGRHYCFDAGFAAPSDGPVDASDGGTP